MTHGTIKRYKTVLPKEFHIWAAIDEIHVKLLEDSYTDVFLAFPESLHRCASLQSDCLRSCFPPLASSACWGACLSPAIRTCCWSPVLPLAVQLWIWKHQYLVYMTEGKKKKKYDLFVLIVLNWDSEFVLLKFFCFSNPHWNTVFSFLMTYTPTFHKYSIHKIHCFPQKTHLHSSTRFLLLAQCPLKLLHKLCPDLLTQTWKTNGKGLNNLSFHI